MIPRRSINVAGECAEPCAPARRALRTLPDTTYKAIRRELLLRLPDNRDSEHPLFWAAFGYTGAW